MEQKIRLEKIYDSDGSLRGYKLGEWYLVKHYYEWTKGYFWMVNKTGNCTYLDCEVKELMRNKELFFVDSCKAGKELLKQKYNEYLA